MRTLSRSQLVALVVPFALAGLGFVGTVHAGSDAMKQPRGGPPATAEVATASLVPSLGPDYQVPPGISVVVTPPAWAASYRGMIDGVETNQKVVALTFDDGPTSRTRGIVAELTKARAHATFFWVGSRIDTATARFAAAHNDELGNHTWSHPEMGSLTAEETSEQIGWTSARIAQVTGLSPVWFRSPFNRVFGAELSQVAHHGLLYANYNVSSNDWIKGATEKGIVWTIMHNLHPGAVVLMHDSPTHDPRYLPQLLRALRRAGYRAVTLTSLARLGPPIKGLFRLGQQGLEP
jgi:peptidoglycan/xylan/chitin deacetylase (PgdA/CDA1 family)